MTTKIEDILAEKALGKKIDKDALKSIVSEDETK